MSAVPSGPAQTEMLGECPPGLQPPCGLMAPRNIGLAHVKLMLQHPGRYLVKPDIVEKFLRAVYQTLWDGR